jgi:cytoskeletal protein RodZ
MRLSVGDIFIRERNKKHLSLREVERITRIRRRYLEAIESNDWDIFESKIYITGVIKGYAKYLGIDQEKMIAYFRRDYEKHDHVQFKKKVESKYFHPETKKFIIAGVVFVFLIFFGYFIYQLSIFLSPPDLEILAPKERKFKSDKNILIEAKTEPDAEINIFGERVFQNEEGVFTYDLPLKKGKNELVIEVIGANGKKTVKEITFSRER